MCLACNSTGVSRSAVARSVEYPDQIQCGTLAGGGLHGQRGDVVCRRDVAICELAAD
ncbi:hypothetical protein D3C85_1777590 [compost metagenome]